MKQHSTITDTEQQLGVRVGIPAAMKIKDVVSVSGTSSLVSYEAQITRNYQFAFYVIIFVYLLLCQYSFLSLAKKFTKLGLKSFFHRGKLGKKL